MVSRRVQATHTGGWGFWKGFGTTFRGGIVTHSPAWPVNGVLVPRPGQLVLEEEADLHQPDPLTNINHLVDVLRARRPHAQKHEHEPTAPGRGRLGCATASGSSPRGPAPGHDRLPPDRRRGV